MKLHVREDHGRDTQGTALWEACVGYDGWAGAASGTKAVLHQSQCSDPRAMAILGKTSNAWATSKAIPDKITLGKRSFDH